MNTSGSDTRWTLIMAYFVGAQTTEESYAEKIEKVLAALE